MAQKSQKISAMKQSGSYGFAGGTQVASKETLHFLQFKQEYEEFKRFCRNSLLSLRKELENVLFACFLYLLRLGLDRRLTAEEHNERFKIYRNLLDANKTFMLNPRLVSEVYKIAQALNFEQFPQGFSDSLEKIIGTVKPVVFLTQFSQECLFSFLEFEKLSFIQNSLSSFITIKILRDPFSEANYKYEFLRFYQNEDLEKMSIGSVQTFPNKSDVEFYQALDFLKKKRLFSTLSNNNSTKRPSKSGTSNPPTFQELGLFSEVFKGVSLPEGTNDLPLPEMKLASKVSYAINYLERANLSEENKPSILQVTVTDQLENITCIEIGMNANIIACGFLDSSIIFFVLNPNFLDFSSSKESVLIPENPSEQLRYYGYHKLLGHSSAITALSLLYDEFYLLSSSVDTIIRLWCLRSKSCLAIYQGHINTIWTVKFNPKGYYFASGSSDTTAKLWSMDRISPLRVFVGHNSDVTIVEFLTNSMFLVTSGLDSRIIFWELSSGTKVRVLFHYQEAVSSLALSPSGCFMVTGSQEGSLILWDLIKFVRTNSWEGEEKDKKNKIAFLGFSADETYLLVGTKKRISLFLVKNLKERKNVDIYEDMKLEDSEETAQIKKNEEVKEEDFFDNQGQDYFFSGRFHEKNSILIVSKSLF